MNLSFALGSSQGMSGPMLERLCIALIMCGRPRQHALVLFFGFGYLATSNVDITILTLCTTYLRVLKITTIISKTDITSNLRNHQTKTDDFFKFTFRKNFNFHLFVSFVITSKMINEIRKTDNFNLLYYASLKTLVLSHETAK